MLSEERVTELPVTEPPRLIAVGVLEPVAAVPLAEMERALVPALTEPPEVMLTLPELEVMELGEPVEARAAEMPTSPVVAVREKPPEEEVALLMLIEVPLKDKPVRLVLATVVEMEPPLVTERFMWSRPARASALPPLLREREPAPVPETLATLLEESRREAEAAELPD